MFVFAKIVQGESRTKQTCLFFIPSRRLSYVKIVQGEGRTKQTCLFFMQVYVQILGYKVSYTYLLLTKE